MPEKSGGVSSAWCHVRTALRLLCGTTVRKDLCMVPCHGCHIYGICTSGSKNVWVMLKIHQLGVVMQVKKVGFFSQGRQDGSYYVMLLYCETLLEVLLGVYCKRFYWILLFTMLLLFYVFEVGKARSATQSVLNNISTE